MKIQFLTLCLIITNFSCAQKAKIIEELYNDGLHQEVIEQCLINLKDNEEDLTSNHLLGRSYVDTKEFVKAIPYLIKSSNKKAPDWMKSWSLSYLGICYYAIDEYEKSKLSLNKAVSLNATKNATKFAKKKVAMFQMSDFYTNWTTMETSNIRFHFQPKNDIKNLEKYCELRQKGFEKNNVFFEATLPKKIDYYIWSNPEEGKRVIGREIGFSTPSLCSINSRIDQTVGHEITHILCEHGIKPKVKNRLINEGIAVAFDLSSRKRIELAKNSNKENLKIKELMNRSDKLPVLVVYTVGGALIEYLFLNDEPNKLKKLAENQTWKNLLDLYGEDLIKSFETKI